MRGAEESFLYSFYLTTLLGITLMTCIILPLIILYCKYGVQSLSELGQEIRIGRARLSFFWLLFKMKWNRTNYMKIWTETAKLYSENTFLVEGKRSLTYKEVDEIADNLAKFLYEKNIRKGKTVIIMMTNSIEFVVAWVAVAKLGAKAALMNSNLRGSSLAHCSSLLDDCSYVINNTPIKRSFQIESPTLGALLNKNVLTLDLRANITDPDIISLESLKLMDLIPLEEHADEKWLGKDLPVEATLGYIYTSGTTGYPKAVPLRFHHLLAVLQVHFISKYNINEHDKIYSVLPLYHSTAFCIGLHLAIKKGASFILRDKLSVTDFWNRMYDNEATIFLYVGEMCRFLLNRKSAYNTKLDYKIRLCIGNGMSKDIWEDFKESFKLDAMAEFYSQTEGFAFMSNVMQKPGSFGYVPKLKIGNYPYRVVKFNSDNLQPVRDRHGFCILSNMNEPGLLITSNQFTKTGGVYHKSDRDVRYLDNVLEFGDQFISTGDIVRIGADRSYYFVDRSGDTFRWKGENVSTLQVADVLISVPGIQQACCYGVKVPGHSGRAGMAALMLDTAYDKFDLAELYAVCNKNLPSFAMPVFIRYVASLETTSTYKYLTGTLKNQSYHLEHSEYVFYKDNANKTYSRLSEIEISEIEAKNLRV